MLMLLIVSLSLVAAFFNAASAIIQRFEAGKPEPHELFRRNFSEKLTRNKRWIAAFGLEVIAFGCQALALRNGSLLVVQPLMSAELVFLMLILHYYRHIPTGKREWGAIVMIILGFTGMLISARPHVGQRPYELSRLILVSSVTAGIIAIGIYIIRRNSSANIRAAVAGIAAGFSFSIVAVFTKIVTRQLSSGILPVFGHWQVWALLAAGIVSIVMTQNAFGAGPVTVSQPTIGIFEPLVSIILGIYLFGDTVNLDVINLFFATLTAAIAAVGIIILGRSKRLRVLEY